MQTPSTEQDRWEVLYLLPEDIATDPAFELPGRGKKAPDQAKEKERITALSHSIETQGQLDLGLVVVGPKSDPKDPTYVIYAGHRRRLALIELNKRNKTNVRMAVRVDPAPYKAVKAKVIASNVQRLNLSPIAFAEVCQQVRKDNDWLDAKHTPKVAAYLNVDQATVSQAEKLLRQTADKPKLRAQVEDGTLSAETALSLSAVDIEVATEIINKAAEKQATKRQVEGKAPSTRIESPEIKAAAREVRESIRKQKEKAAVAGDKKAEANWAKVEKQLESVKTARTRKDMLLWAESLDAPIYGGESSLVREFARYFINKWATGDGTDKTLYAKFDAMLSKDATKVSAEDKAKAAAAEAKAAKDGKKK